MTINGTFLTSTQVKALVAASDNPGLNDYIAQQEARYTYLATCRAHLPGTPGNRDANGLVRVQVNFQGGSSTTVRVSLDDYNRVIAGDDTPAPAPEAPVKLTPEADAERTARRIASVCQDVCGVGGSTMPLLADAYLKASDAQKTRIETDLFAAERHVADMFAGRSMSAQKAAWKCIRRVLFVFVELGVAVAANEDLGIIVDKANNLN